MRVEVRASAARDTGERHAIERTAQERDPGAAGRRARPPKLSFSFLVLVLSSRAKRRIPNATSRCASVPLCEHALCDRVRHGRPLCEDFAPPVDSLLK